MTRLDRICLALCVAWLAALAWICVAASRPILEAIARAGTAEWLSATATLAAVVAALGIAASEVTRTERETRKTKHQAERDAVFNSLVLVTALLVRVAQCCVAARADLLRGTGSRAMAAELRPFVDRLRGTDYARLPSEIFFQPIIVVTSQGEAAIRLLELFESWTDTIPNDAFDDIYQRLARHHSALVTSSAAAGIVWKGRTHSGPFERDAAYWAASVEEG